MITRATRWIRLPLVILTMVLSILALTAAPSAAHTSIVNQGDDQAVTDPDHMSGSVCDLEKDGRWVVATWYTESGEQIATADVGGQFTCDEESWGVPAEYVIVCEYGLDGFKCSEDHKV